MTAWPADRSTIGCALIVDASDISMIVRASSGRVTHRAIETSRRAWAVATGATGIGLPVAVVLRASGIT